MGFEPTEEAAEYLNFSPVGADRNRITREVFVSRVKAARELPENLRLVYFEDTTAAWFRTLPKRIASVSEAQARELAALLGEILRGELSAATLERAIASRLGADPVTTTAIAKEFTKTFITQNYFQIAHVYEKKQRGKDRVSGAPASPPGTPPRVVDLRSGSAPHPA